MGNNNLVNSFAAQVAQSPASERPDASAAKKVAAAVAELHHLPGERPGRAPRRPKPVTENTDQIAIRCSSEVRDEFLDLARAKRFPSGLLLKDLLDVYKKHAASQRK